MRLVKLGRSVLLERFTKSRKLPLQLPTDKPIRQAINSSDIDLVRSARKPT